MTRDPRAIAECQPCRIARRGAFGDCMANLERYELIPPIQSAIQSGKPFLGICLGLQLLFTESEKFGIHRALASFWPRQKFSLDPSLKVPHMGWNEIPGCAACSSVGWNHARELLLLRTLLLR